MDYEYPLLYTIHYNFSMNYNCCNNQLKDLPHETTNTSRDPHVTVETLRNIWYIDNYDIQYIYIHNIDIFRFYCGNQLTSLFFGKEDEEILKKYI